MPPYLISCEEIIADEKDNTANSLLIRIKMYTEIDCQIFFPKYIMHLTQNESYTAWDNYKKRKGNYLIIFDKSRFIDFYDDVIIHTENYLWPSRDTHYGIYTCSHIIDVISENKPVITQL